MKYTFIQEDSDRIKTIIKHEIDGIVSLTDLVEHFERFLKASGYVFDGYLDFVDDKGENEPKDTPEFEIGWYNIPDEPGITRLGISEK